MDLRMMFLMHETPHAKFDYYFTENHMLLEIFRQLGPGRYIVETVSPQRALVFTE